MNLTKWVVGLACTGLLLAACSSTNNNGGGSSTPSGAVRGGTLTLVGQGDVDYFDTAAGYYDVTYTLFRAITRQLYQYPSASTTAGEINPVPDMATGMPTLSNGGKTVTIHIKQGVDWNTTPPRQVTAKDVILGFKRLCNPVAPVGYPGYFTGTIVGMADFCTAFGNVNGTVADIKNFIDSNNISGIKAVDSTTVQFNLLQPASDFVNILAMTFSSPAPVEDLNYLPASPDLAQHFLSDGPYEVQSYTPNRSITLVRNPAWQSSTDTLRQAYVNQMNIEEGVATSATSAVQQIQAGTADLEWDQNVDTAQLASMIATKDPNLFIGPEGQNYFSLNPYLSINMQSPNNNGALKKLPVRQALEYAINKTADSQIYGGAAISAPLDQPVPSGQVGSISGYNPYPTTGHNGDAAKAKQLLAQAGYQPGQITLKLIYRTNTVHPQVAQNDQAALQAAGFNVQLVPVTPANTIYTKYLENPTASTNGDWDIAEPGWNPDWLGNNGRSVIAPLFDGRTYGKNTQDYGDYKNPTVDSLIDKAEQASSVSQATSYWQQAAKQIMADAAIVPIGQQKVAVYKSTRTQNALFNIWTDNIDPTNVWLKR